MLGSGAESLAYAARPRVVVHFLGQLGLMLALLTCAPLIASVVFGEFAVSLRYAIVITGILALSWPAARVKIPKGVQGNEALTVTALAFILAPLVMTFPLQASAGLGFVDAFFEAVSAATTTGLSMVPDPDTCARTFVFARAWMQWYGGLGIAVLSIALLMGQSVTTRRLIEPKPTDTFVTTTRAHARRVLQVYGVLTVLAIITLSLLAGDLEHGLAHALAAVSTGGFSSHADSLASTSTAFAFAVLGFSLLGAITLPLYYYVFRMKASRLWVDVEWAWLLGAVAIGALLLVATLFWQHGLPVGTAVKEGLLLSMSAQSTAGFASLAPGELNDFGLGVLMTQMLIGGNVGSTAGGIKLLHILILARIIQIAIQRAGMGSHAVVTPRLFGEPIEPQTLTHALLVVVLFVLTVLVSWLIFLAHGMPPMASLFEIISATGTVGLSTGLTGQDLPTTLKLVLCFDMLAGRVEVVALLVLLWPGTWIGRRYAS